MTRGPENVTREERVNELTEEEKLMRDINPVGKHNTYQAVAQG